MNTSAGRLYQFGPFLINTAEGLLLRGNEPVPLTPKAFETLLALVESRGHVVGKDELMRRIWPDSFVEENNLSQNVSLLRKALGEGADGLKYIETVPKRGYRFTANVSEGLDERGGGASPPPPPPPAMQSSQVLPPPRITVRPAASSQEFDSIRHAPPETKYARSGDVNIAYQVIGDAPLDLVFVMGWVSHLEYFWTEPSFARFLKRLASFSRVILFDKRGTGLSDRVPVAELPTLEQRMDDVRAVMDAVGSKRAALCGVSEGGPMSALFAATYPEKTAALVMIGTYAKRIWAEDYPWAPTTKARQEFYGEMQRDWGGPVGIEERAPSAASDPHFRDWWATYLRMGASPGAALALTRMNAEIDVRHVLPSIRVPTLVLHRTGDACLKIEEGRYVAERIPGAKFIELPGVDHLPFVGDQDAIINEVEEFLTGVRHTLEPDRVLATVLSTRIVGPVGSRAADSVGPDWRAQLERYRADAKKEVAWYRGREMLTSDDGFLATFDGPARAIRAACAINEAARRSGIEIRAGLHTGECDLTEDKVSGVAVGVSIEVAARAAAGEILVSSTVKDLVAGSGINFVERGEHALEAIPGAWRLFAVDRGGCAP